jgi:hypothetical protein
MQAGPQVTAPADAEAGADAEQEPDDPLEPPALALLPL